MPIYHFTVKTPEWPVTAMEKLSQYKGTNPSSAALFIAERVQMSIIYADMYKHCCHINNCVAKIVTEKLQRVKCRKHGMLFISVNHIIL